MSSLADCRRISPLHLPFFSFFFSPSLRHCAAGWNFGGISYEIEECEYTLFFLGEHNLYAMVLISKKSDLNVLFTFVQVAFLFDILSRKIKIECFREPILF